MDSGYRADANEYWMDALALEEERIVLDTSALIAYTHSFHRGRSDIRDNVPRMRKTVEALDFGRRILADTGAHHGPKIVLADVAAAEFIDVANLEYLRDRRTQCYAHADRSVTGECGRPLSWLPPFKARLFEELGDLIDQSIDLKQGIVREASTVDDVFIGEGYSLDSQELLRDIVFDLVHRTNWKLFNNGVPTKRYNDTVIFSQALALSHHEDVALITGDKYMRQLQALCERHIVDAAATGSLVVLRPQNAQHEEFDDQVHVPELAA